MVIMKRLLSLLLVVVVMPLSAQDGVDTLRSAGVAMLRSDSLAMARKIDSLQSALDSLRRVKPQPVKPIRTLGLVSAVDTLATESEALSIILFNDNTWRYMLTEAYERDTAVFNDHWDTQNTHAYADVELSSLPQSIAIQLVDSLSSYHYPYVGRLSSRYGPRRGRPHQGVDLPLKVGDPIYATFDGKVRLSKVAGNYGNLVIIRHNNGLETYYAHLSARSVEVGDWVVAGQQIGLGGNTGRSTGPHLHFETRYYGQSFDPERLIDFKSGTLCRETFLLKRSYFSIYSRASQDFEDEIANEEQDKKEQAEREAMRYHKIRSGDTLGAIARKYGTTVRELQAVNGGADKVKTLRIGQRLALPGAEKDADDAASALAELKGATAKTAPAKAVPQKAAAPAEKKAVQGQAEDYVVQNGDSIWRITHRFGMSAEEFRELNGAIDSSSLRVGATVKIIRKK